jgi:prepilin-type N-terminal cleavage/methylation domain-containing protein/prepilin-type processing-associated H-X9-DG protein
MSGKSRGFTLIELLVVVAIIALLIAILLPSLARAREQSKTLICGTHMRQVGQLVSIYAGEHDGRGPGGGNGTEQGRTTSDSLAWNDILNAEVLNRGSYGVGARTSESSPVTTLSCPNYMAASATDYSRTGQNTYGYPYPTPQDFNSYYPDAQPLNLYWLGARVNLFRGDQFMLIESYASNDVTGCVEGLNDRGQLGTIQGFPSYTSLTYGPVSNGNGPAFRHPFQKAANFLYIDGHIQVLTPKDDVADHPSNYNGWSLVGPGHMAMP